MEYSVKFTATITVEAEDSVEAEAKARELLSIDDMYVYVDGNLMNNAIQYYSKILTDAVEAWDRRAENV